MHYTYRNINEAFNGIVRGICEGSIPAKEQHDGKVRLSGPIVLTYSYPMERVLFNKIRSLNPFMNLYQSLWNLAGQLHTRDSALTAGKVTGPAIGHRWRNQLKVVINKLHHTPYDRHAVIQIWDSHSTPTNDLYGSAAGVDEVPSAISLVFEAENNNNKYDVLNLTVYSRSNNLLTDFLGTDLVLYSFLQEYVSQSIGIRVGKLHQISSSLYFDAVDWLGNEYLNEHLTMHSPEYGSGRPISSIQTPLVTDPQRFDSECEEFTRNMDCVCTEPFLVDVAQPMMLAYRHHLYNETSKSFESLNRVQAMDWKVAGIQWIQSQKGAVV